VTIDPEKARFVLDLDGPFHVAGHRGLVGSALWRHLEQRGHTALLGHSSTELDLRDRASVFDFYAENRPQYVILAAARVGGIGANSTYPAEFLSDNVRIQVNVLDAAQSFGVERLLFLGSSCIYPKLAAQPIRESALLTGPLEPTNEAYAIAKIAGIVHVQSQRRQYGSSFISAMPTNLYGPGDNFDLANSHVLPAMIRRFHDAMTQGDPVVQLWGTGRPRREFLHVDDLASASITLLESYDNGSPINVGTGNDLSISELAELIKDIVGFSGEIEWDTRKPDGTPRKLLDVSRITELGWRPAIPLRDGIASTYGWYRDHLARDVRLSG
jgi:GDP-L-fucose synthase